MVQALSQPVRHPGQCLDGLAAVARRLTEDLGVTITHVDLPPGVLGDWDNVTRTVHVRATAPDVDQLWLLVQVWLLVAIGPEATPAHPQPYLQLVHSAG